MDSHRMFSFQILFVLVPTCVMNAASGLFTSSSNPQSLAFGGLRFPEMRHAPLPFIKAGSNVHRRVSDSRVARPDFPRERGRALGFLAIRSFCSKVLILGSTRF